MNRDPNPLFVAAVASGALLLALCIAFLTDTETPPASGNPLVAPTAASPSALVGDRDRALSASRSNLRTTPPIPPGGVVRSQTPPAPNQDAASRAETQSPSVAPAGKRGLGAGGLPPLLLLIRDHESGGNYQAFNPTGCEGYGCGGAYQLHAKYAAGWAAEAGYPGMSSQAQTWPPQIQDAVALFKFNATGGRLWCDWTDYC